MRAITKWLIFGHSATAPKVILGSKYRFFDLKTLKIKVNLQHKAQLLAALGTGPALRGAHGSLIWHQTFGSQHGRLIANLHSKKTLGAPKNSFLS